MVSHVLGLPRHPQPEIPLGDPRLGLAPRANRLVRARFAPLGGSVQVLGDRAPTLLGGGGPVAHGGLGRRASLALVGRIDEGAHGARDTSCHIIPITNQAGRAFITSDRPDRSDRIRGAGTALLGAIPLHRRAENRGPLQDRGDDGEGVGGARGAPGGPRLGHGALGTGDAPVDPFQQFEGARLTEDTLVQPLPRRQRVLSIRGVLPRRTNRRHSQRGHLVVLLVVGPEHLAILVALHAGSEIVGPQGAALLQVSLPRSQGQEGAVVAQTSDLRKCSPLLVGHVGNRYRSISRGWGVVKFEIDQREESLELYILLQAIGQLRAGPFAIQPELHRALEPCGPVPALNAGVALHHGEQGVGDQRQSGPGHGKTAEARSSAGEPAPSAVVAESKA
mmetsp:Transcript_46722/g.105984  ORF Transcript_46722/g.105984 Transcript_46722/m.105984 type:complete len:392 (+) Transcript_46722:1954-3129(+)